MDVAKGSAVAAAGAVDEDDDEEYEEELEEKIPAEMRKLIKDKADGKYLLSLNEVRLLCRSVFVVALEGW